MKVILSGYSKTGTKTMRAAFDILGYNTYDYLENAHYLYKEWISMFSGKGDIHQLAEKLKDIDAVTDSPCFYFWEDLHKAFPDSKIILTTRDEDEWYESLKKHLGRLSTSFGFWFTCNFTLYGWQRYHFFRNSMKLMADMPAWPFAQIKILSPNVLKTIYKAHNSYVQKEAPKEKLLVFNVSEGWEPLCRFLDLEVPHVPFPHKNRDGRTIEESAKSQIGTRIRNEMLLTISVFVFFGSIVLAWLL